MNWHENLHTVLDRGLSGVGSPPGGSNSQSCFNITFLSFKGYCSSLLYFKVLYTCIMQ